MVTIRNFRKAYGKKVILRIESMKFDRGMYWIKGANGSGKSTFFKAICGISPFEGECELDGVDLKKSPVAFRRMISYCEAEPFYPEFLTARDLMHFTGKVKSAPAGRREELLSTLAMEDFFESPIRTYSSGMLKKTGLALALLGNPRVVCLDEPFTTIDRKSLENLLGLIRDYHENRGVTFLISSHVEDPDARLPYTKTLEIKNTNLIEPDS